MSDRPIPTPIRQDVLHRRPVTRANLPRENTRLALKEEVPESCGSELDYLA